MAQRKSRIAEIALRVRDLEKMTQFYQDMLGFRLNHSVENINFLEVGPTGGALDGSDHPQLFALFNRNPDFDQAKSTFDHIAFEVAPEAYQDEYDRFDALGMIISERKWPDTLPWKGQSFFFRDPEENVVEIKRAVLRRKSDHHLSAIALPRFEGHQTSPSEHRIY